MIGEESEGSSKDLDNDGTQRPSRSAQGSMQSRIHRGRSPRVLPPIGNGAAAGHSGQHHTPEASKSADNDQKRSRFHTGCMSKHPLYMDWSAVKTDKKQSLGIGHVKTRSLASLKDEEERYNVIHYLDNNKDFLEGYVTQFVSQEHIEKWLLGKMKTKQADPNFKQLARYKQKGAPSGKQVLKGLLKTLNDVSNEHSVLWELAKSIALAVGVDAYRIYKLYPDLPNFAQYFVSDPTMLPYDQPAPKTLNKAEPQQVALIAKVAKRGACWRLSRLSDPLNIPETPPSLLRAFRITNVKTANYVMYQPILSKSGNTAYVIEMWRIRDRFRDVDEDISSNFLVSGSLALHYCNLYLDKRRERNMSDFLLDLVKAIFEEMVSLDHLIKIILKFAQKLVNADRASLFLVDYRNSELVSTVFDLKFEPGIDMDVEKNEIRMPINRGIAGHVALSGEPMNIPDAYSDYRFNREVDEATGYKTKSILCMPIKVEGRVIGVVQMVNKRDDNNFDHEDEMSFEICASFFGLALHNARLYDRIRRKEQKYKVALEVLSYHNTCRENEVQAMIRDTKLIAVNLDDFYLDPFKFSEFEKCKSVIAMFDDLFDLSTFDIITVTRFVLTVKKNYRTVPYHNFDHGWSVAHAMYTIIKNDTKKRFNYTTRLALFVACLCHDLDHRGYTNKYMSETASPLAAMYSTSTLEHHHFNITVTILQQDGHNIFGHISSEEYKEILGLIKHCILATDLAAFFPNLEKLKMLHVDDRPQFSWSVPNHRELAMAISMTAADLSASAKPWEVQIKTVKVIFEEFYDQGDKERAAGRTPIAMMDRIKTDEQPASQVGFLSQICVPCYSMLHRILPNTIPMYYMATKNLDRWRSKAEIILHKLERKGDEPQVEEATSDEEIDIHKEDEEESEAEATSKANVARQESKTVVGDASSSSITWEDIDEFENEESVASGIFKDIDGEMWIKEANVLVKKESAAEKADYVKYLEK